jgi:hypothetical protein
MLLKIILAWLGFTAFVWMPVVFWYKVKDKPGLRTYAAIYLAGNVILALTYGAWFLLDLPIVIPLIGLGAHVVLRLVGGIVLRRSDRRNPSASGERAEQDEDLL